MYFQNTNITILFSLFPTEWYCSGADFKPCSQDPLDIPTDRKTNKIDFTGPDLAPISPL